MISINEFCFVFKFVIQIVFKWNPQTSKVNKILLILRKYLLRNSLDLSASKLDDLQNTF